MLTWRGKCGFIGGVTPALDRYHTVIAALGDRFLLLRMPDPDPGEAGRMALTHRGHETEMREQLRAALAGLVDHADISQANRNLTPAETDELVRLATFTARARTGVERDGYSHDVLYLPQVEGPGRLVTAYARMLAALEAIGCDPATCWDTLARIALDCAPPGRITLARNLLAYDKPTRTRDVAESAGIVTKTAHRCLEDLSLIGLADWSKSSGADNSADLWAASSQLRELWPESKTEKYPPAHSTYERSATGTAQEPVAQPAVGHPVLLGPTQYSPGCAECQRRSAFGSGPCPTHQPKDAA